MKFSLAILVLLLVAGGIILSLHATGVVADTTATLLTISVACGILTALIATGPLSHFTAGWDKLLCVVLYLAFLAPLILPFLLVPPRGNMWLIAGGSFLFSMVISTVTDFLSEAYD